MKSLLCTAALLLGALVSLVEFQQAEAQCGNFQQSCINIGIDGSTGWLSAQCYTFYGYIVGAAINLNEFLGNNDGSLGSGVNFTDSCQDIAEFDQGSKFIIEAYCPNVNGALQLTLYDIGYQVSNNNGVLIWTYCN